MNDFKEIAFDKVEKSPELPKKSKPPVFNIRNHIAIKAEQLLDFDFIDLDIIFLIAVLSHNSVLIYSFSKANQKLSLERKRVFYSPEKISSNNPESLYVVSFGTMKSGDIILACGGLFGYLYLIYMEDEEDKIQELPSNNGELYTLAFPPELIDSLYCYTS